MSFQDSAVIFFIALLLFGPKKLPELARQIGKLMGEFRRASNDFRIQMEDRISEQAERQKQIAAIEAAAPASVAELPPLMTALPAAAEHTGDASYQVSPSDPHPSSDLLPGTAVAPEILSGSAAAEQQIPEHTIAQPPTPEPPPDRYRHAAAAETPAAPLPIATSGDLNMMPPSTGLPVSRSKPGSHTAVAETFDSIPQAPSATAAGEAERNSGTAHHG